MADQEQQKDPEVFECLFSDTFWILGAVIVAFSYWASRQLQQKDKPDAESEQSSNGVSRHDSTTPKPTVVLSNDSWLWRHVTSPARRVVAIIACLLVLATQLIEGSWVIQTTWRLTAVTMKGTFPHKKPYVLGSLVFLIVLAFMLAIWAAVLSAGIYLISTQFILISQLYQIRLGSSPPSNHGEESSQQDTGRDRSQDDERARLAAWGEREEEQEVLLSEFKP